MRPRRSTTSTIACAAPTGESSEPGRRQQRGRRCGELCDLDRARAQRAVLRAVQVPGDEHVDRRAEHDHRDQRSRAAAATSSAGGGSSAEDEPDAAHGLDQRRLAELAPQVRDVPVDDVRVRVAVPDLARAPARASRRAARDAAAARAAPPRARSARARGRRAVATRRSRSSVRSAKASSRLGLLAAAQQRADACEQLLGLERLDEVVVGAGVEARDAVGQPRRAPSAAGPASRAPCARSRRQTASPSRPGIATSSTIRSGTDRSTAASAAPPSAAACDVVPARR